MAVGRGVRRGVGRGVGLGAVRGSMVGAGVGRGVGLGVGFGARRGLRRRRRLRGRRGDRCDRDGAGRERRLAAVVRGGRDDHRVGPCRQGARPRVGDAGAPGADPRPHHRVVAAADADRHPVRARSADVAIDSADQDRGRRRPVSWRDDGVGEARLVRGGRHRRRERGQQQGGGGDCPEPPGHLCCRTTIPDAQGSASRPGRRPMPARGCRPGRGRAMVRGSGSKPPSGRPREWPVVPRQRALDGAVRSGPADGPTAAGRWPGIVMAPGRRPALRSARWIPPPRPAPTDRPPRR